MKYEMYVTVSANDELLLEAERTILVTTGDRSFVNAAPVL